MNPMTLFSSHNDHYRIIQSENIRTLKIGVNTHTSVDLKNHVSVFFYHRMFYLPFYYRDDKIKSILMLGAGGGGFAHQLHYYNPQVTSITQIDIDAHVIELAHKYFLPPNDHISYVHQDALDYVNLQFEQDKKYDYILLDCFDTSKRLPEVPKKLVSSSFFMRIKGLLPPHGLFSINYVGRMERPMFKYILYNLKKHFPFIHIIPRYKEMNRTQNFVFTVSLEKLPSPDEIALLVMGSKKEIPLKMEKDIENIIIQYFPEMLDDYLPK